jgi:hypothetical protein
MTNFENYDEPATIITIGGDASNFISVIGDYDQEYSNAGGKFMQKRAANVQKRQAAKQSIVQAKSATKQVKQQAKADKKVGKQQVRQAKQVAKQDRKTARVEARDVKKQTLIVMRSGAKAARVQGRQDKKNIRLDNRMARRDVRQPVEPIYEEPQYDEELPLDTAAETGYSEDSYAPEETGYETNATVEEGGQEYGSEYPAEEGGEYYEEDYSSDANPNYSEGGYDEYLPDYASEEGGYADEFDQEYAQANGPESFIVGARSQSRRQPIITTRIAGKPGANVGRNRIVIPSEQKSNFDANESTKGLIAIDAADDYDAPEDTVVTLEPKSGFDGVTGISKTTMALAGLAALVTIGIVVTYKSK